MSKANSKGNSRWKRSHIVAALGLLAMTVVLGAYLLAPSTYTLRDALAKQLGEDPKFIQLNVPPIPGLYPGAVIVHPEAGKLALLVSSLKPVDAPGPEFSIKGASLTDSDLSVATRTDVLSQLLSESDRYSFTIDLVHARVYERQLLDLKKTVLADADILSAYRKGAKPEVVHRTYEAVPTITVRRNTKVSAEEWAKIKDRAALESQAQVNSDDSTSFVAATPVVLAFQTVEVEYLSDHLGAEDKPDGVKLKKVERIPEETFAERPQAAANADLKQQAGFACFYCGQYAPEVSFNLVGAASSARLVEESLSRLGGTSLLAPQSSSALSMKDFYDRLEELKRAVGERRPTLLIVYWMGHMVSLRTGSLYLVTRDAQSSLPGQDDFALIRHEMQQPSHPASGSNAGDIYDVLQQVESDSSADEPGLVSVAELHHRLSELKVPFAMLIDGCFDRKDLEELRSRLSFDQHGDYYGPNLGSGEEQIKYQHAMDAFGRTPYLRSKNIIVLAAKPGSRAVVVPHPFHAWDLSPRVGPLAARLAQHATGVNLSLNQQSWGTLFAKLVDWRGTGEIGFRGTVSWSDFGTLDNMLVDSRQ